MAAESSRSSLSADSYIGSVISLTSKSEIRYEGILCNINVNTDDSSIGLKNVRSFGTEGRKKEGAQVPPSDKIYGYILFRGSDIKDLQVKSSPPAQTTSINNDPAIIQSHYTRSASTSTSTMFGTGSLADHSSHAPHVGLAGPGSSFQGGVPLYQPGGNVGPWGPSAPPNANGSGLAMPMYWQGFYGPPNGLPPHLHQQSLLRPPPGLSLPPMQYPGFNASLPSGSSNLPVLNMTEFPSSLPPGTSSLNLSSSFSSSPLPPSLPPVPSAMLASEVLPTLVRNKALNPAFPTLASSVGLASVSHFNTSSLDVGAFATPISKPNAIPPSNHPFQAMSQSNPSAVGASGIENPAPSLITPGQLLPPGPSASSASQSLQTSHKEVEVIQVSSSLAEQSVPVPKESQPPILPLPVPAPAPARTDQKMNGALYQTPHVYRERGQGSRVNRTAFQTHHVYMGRERRRGSGSSRPVAKVTEDFDFTIMNEKFNKVEVWGDLGRSSNSRDREVDGDLNDFEEFQAGDDAESKLVYNKDDFFDTLSCKALNRDSQNGRMKFFEQMKIDTETFGGLSRQQGGMGRRGFYHGSGRSRGSYFGGDYGYSARGQGPGPSQGRGMPHRAV